jgi:hypothetical protein
MKKRFSQERSIGFLRDAEGGMPLKMLFRLLRRALSLAHQGWRYAVVRILEHSGVRRRLCKITQTGNDKKFRGLAMMMT